MIFKPKTIKNLSVKYGIFNDRAICCKGGRPFAPCIHCAYPYRFNKADDLIVTEWFKVLLFMRKCGGTVKWCQLAELWNTASNLEPLRYNPKIMYQPKRGYYTLTENAKEYIDIILGMIESECGTWKGIKKNRYYRDANKQLQVEEIMLYI